MINSLKHINMSYADNIIRNTSGHYDTLLRSIRLMHESAIGGHDQWLPRCRSNIGIGNEIVGSFLLVLHPMALYAIWTILCNLKGHCIEVGVV